jgi:site-specific recombinase XerD
MQERHGQFSRDALNEFLDFVGDKGLLKKTTAQARKIASNIVLGILDEDESADLSKVDLENVIQRHRNLAAGKITPRTLATYESRTRIAVRDFFEYVKNPSSWKPGQQRTRKPSKAIPSKKPKTVTSAGKPAEFEKHEESPWRPSVHIDLQIHISPEATPEQIDQIFDSISRHLPSR